MTDVPTRWVHHDPDLTAHLERAMGRALGGDWVHGSLLDRATDLQALAVATAYYSARMVGSERTTTMPDGDMLLYIDPRPTGLDVPAERRRVAATLYRSMALLVAGQHGAEDVETFAATGSGETGALPAIAIVAIVAVGAAAYAYVGHEAAKVVDRHLMRREVTRRMMQSHASMLKVVENHVEREEKAGKPLPLDAASRAALDQLGRTQHELATKVEPNFGDFLPEPAQSGLGWALVLVPVAIVGALLLSKG